MAPPPPPAHLSEFLSYVNGTANKVKEVDANEDSDKVDGHGLNKVENELKKKLKLSKRRSNVSTATSNITSSNSSMNWSIGSEMTASTLDLEVILTKKDIQDSLQQLKELEDVSKELSDGLKHVSDLFGKFAQITENISRSKGSGRFCESLGAFSNYQYLISNQHRYLSEVLKTKFGDEINSIKTEFTQQHDERTKAFENEYKELVKELKVSEKLESKLRRSRTRNLIVYKNNLNDLSNKLNQIDHVHHDYYVDSFELLEKTHGKILNQEKNIFNQESIVFEKLADKTKPGNGLDGLIIYEESIPDEDETYMDETINGNDTEVNDTINSISNQNLINLVINEISDDGSIIPETSSTKQQEEQLTDTKIETTSVEAKDVEVETNSQEANDIEQLSPGVTELA
ncbi:hypothetical protein CANINC_003187 [Pichia inconspicua]|uniref:Uncharacterized protein n=1 Tax=Pichia inconspicua TaxID=52247 RepID=A0A4T0WZN2_9ASCO|nr:hypothetical protein CANINC_003187 [[Candida] inconspicua]